MLDRESELRKLRKASKEYEEQNAILSKHIDNLKAAISKLEDEETRSKGDIKGLEPFLKNFRHILFQTLYGVHLPDSEVELKEESIDQFVEELCKLYQNPTANGEIMAKIKQIISSMDYPK